jgi:YHS domain-containing protein
LKTELVAKDPVCGMTVEPSSAAAKRVHDGETIYFCAEGCAEAFDRDPKKYLRQSALKGNPPAEKPPSAHPVGRSLRETRPSIAAGAEV